MRVEKINAALLDAVLEKARQSPRRRTIHCLHQGDWEHAHRMLNALTPGTYVRPHRHASEYNGEGFVLLRGRMAVLIFDEEGAVNVEKSCVLSLADGQLGMEIEPGVWHSLVALEETVIYEVKGQPSGGYVQATDKNFAPWSPEEGAVDAESYVQRLEEMAANVEATAAI